MVLVDSSVWIEFLRNRVGRVGERLEALIHPANHVCSCGIVLQEVLQGLISKADVEKTEVHLRRFPYVAADADTHVRAASIYRMLRGRGVTVPGVDATLAAICIENGLDFMTLDLKHFGPIARWTTLRLLTPA